MFIYENFGVVFIEGMFVVSDSRYVFDDNVVIGVFVFFV